MAFHRLHKLLLFVFLLSLLFFFSCSGFKDRSTEQVRGFYLRMKREFLSAIDRIEEGVSASQSADLFRKRMGIEIAKLSQPSLIWDEYRRACELLRFYEIVEKLCGKDRVSRSRQIDDTSLSAVSVGYVPSKRCRRLYLFSAFFTSVILSRINVLPGKFLLPQKVFQRVQGAEHDPDCLVRGGYFFMVQQDEQAALSMAHKLVTGRKTYRCGLDFLPFLEPGDLWIILDGVANLLRMSKLTLAGEQGYYGVNGDFVMRLKPLIRQEAGALRKNLKHIYTYGKIQRRMPVLFMFYAFPELVDVEFLTGVVQNSPVPAERVMVGNILKRSGTVDFYPTGASREKGFSNETHRDGGKVEEELVSVPSLSFVIHGGGIRVKRAVLRRSIQQSLRVFPLCCAKVRRSYPDFKLGDFVMRFDFSHEGQVRYARILRGGWGSRDVRILFLRCLKTSINYQGINFGAGGGWVKFGLSLTERK